MNLLEAKEGEEYIVKEIQTDDEELKQVFEQLIYEKPCCHQFETEKADESLEQREMSKIGG